MVGSVRVLLFATAREAVGAARLDRPVAPDGTSLEELLRELAQDHPPLGRLFGASRFVVNGEYVPRRGTRLRSGDEVAIHPPYSGG